MNIEDNYVQSGMRGNVEMEVAIIFEVSGSNVRTRLTVEGL